jgi:hypothetical protein
VHTSTGEWLEKATSFSARHRVVECGGYGFVAINSSGVLDLGGGPQQAFGRGGPVLYANTSKLSLEDATVAVREDAACSAHDRRRLRLVKDGEGGKDGDGAEGAESGGSGAGAMTGAGDAVAAENATEVLRGAQEDATPNATEAALLATNCTALHTGSQWVILSRAFATYLVRDVRAARWMRVFERRFLSDEAFIQTVLMHSPHRVGLVNHNMRYIYWPHFDGDPQVCHESEGGIESDGYGSPFSAMGSPWLPWTAIESDGYGSPFSAMGSPWLPGIAIDHLSCHIDCHIDYDGLPLIATDGSCRSIGSGWAPTMWAVHK